jgi:hypothetical protein
LPFHSLRGSILPDGFEQKREVAMRKIASFGVAVLVFLSGFATSVFATVSNKALSKSYDQNALDAKRGKKQTATTNVTPAAQQNTTRPNKTKCSKWDRWIGPDGYCYQSEKDYQSYIKFGSH